MNNKKTDAINEVIFQLGQATADKTAFLGFDACIDYIVRIVRGKKDGRITEFFTGSDQFGKFLTDLNNKSCGIELLTKICKPGGNMVITANALGRLGVKADCAGTFGFPEILPVFHNVSPNCSLHSISDTISATALEFDNSKVIMFDPGPYDNLTWQGIKDVLGAEKIIQLLTGKKLISFLNWSEIGNSTQIWKGFLNEIFPEAVKKVQKTYFFTDFSDCSRRSADEIKEALSVLKKFSKYCSVILSLNRNEADLVAAAVGLSVYHSDEEFIKNLYQLTNTDILLIHRTDDGLAFDGRSYEKCETFFCKEPVILTGGGDNFNAGFCFSLFYDLNLYNSLLIANAVAGSYVKTGISPDLNSLTEFLKKVLSSR